MTVPELVARVEARGGVVTTRGEAVVVRPKGVLSEAERATFRARQRDILTHLRSRALGADWTTVHLYSLGRIIEVEIPGFEVRLVIAPGCRIARELRAQDPQPGRIWCACEVIDLLSSGVTPADARAVTEARVLLDAVHQGVRKGIS